MTFSVASGLGLLSAVEGLLGGAAVTLGGVGLQAMEVPEKLPFGGTQKLAEHRFPGGGVVFDATGPQERDIEWSGLFTGTSAVSRARQLDTMRRAGKQIRLTWSSFSRQVVIREFSPDYSRGGAVIPYRIVCAVVTGQPAATPTLLSTLTGDLSSAAGLSGLASGAASAISTAQAALPIAASLTHGSPAFLGIASAVGLAGTAVSAAGSLADGQLGSLGAAAEKAGAVFGSPAALLSASGAQDALAAATGAAGYVGRAVRNLGV